MVRDSIPAIAYPENGGYEENYIHLLVVRDYEGRPHAQVTKIFPCDS
jgi:hypothetical protein